MLAQVSYSGTLRRRIALGLLFKYNTDYLAHSVTGALDDNTRVPRWCVFHGEQYGPREASRPKRGACNSGTRVARDVSAISLHISLTSPSPWPPSPSPP